MSGEAPHPGSRPGGAGALALRLLAGLLVVLAGAYALLFVPFTLLIAATAAPGELGPGIAPWMMYLWCLLAFAASTWVVVAGVGAIEAPRLRRILALLAILLMTFLSLPTSWAGSG